MSEHSLIPDDLTAKEAFERARAYYPFKLGKRGHAVEWAWFCKSCRRHNLNPQIEAYQLLPAIKVIEQQRRRLSSANKFVPEWAYFSTWINQVRWQVEIEIRKDPAPQPVPQKERRSTDIQKAKENYRSAGHQGTLAGQQFLDRVEAGQKARATREADARTEMERRLDRPYVCRQGHVTKGRDLDRKRGARMGCCPRCTDVTDYCTPYAPDPSALPAGDGV